MPFKKGEESIPSGAAAAEPGIAAGTPGSASDKEIFARLLLRPPRMIDDVEPAAVGADTQGGRFGGREVAGHACAVCQ